MTSDDQTEVRRRTNQLTNTCITIYILCYLQILIYFENVVRSIFLNFFASFSKFFEYFYLKWNLMFLSSNLTKSPTKRYFYILLFSLLCPPPLCFLVTFFIVHRYLVVFSPFWHQETLLLEVKRARIYLIIT